MKRHESGFTLIEIIMVLVLTGILAGIVVNFISAATLDFLAGSRRAGLSDSADTALRRLAREVEGALPNSLRITQSGADWYLEFLPVSDGGRYRQQVDASGLGDILDFASGTDAAFDVLGPAVTVASTDSIVIYNLGQDASTDAYAGGNRRAVAGTTGAVGAVQFQASGSPFPNASPGNRFFVVGTPVTWYCDAASRQLLRLSGYAFQATQPANAVQSPLSTADRATVADSVVSCDFRYTPGASQRFGQLTARINLESAARGGEGERIKLYREIRVSNVP